MKGSLPLTMTFVLLLTIWRFCILHYTVYTDILHIQERKKRFIGIGASHFTSRATFLINVLERERESNVASIKLDIDNEKL